MYKINQHQLVLGFLEKVIRKEKKCYALHIDQNTEELFYNVNIPCTKKKKKRRRRKRNNNNNQRFCLPSRTQIKHRPYSLHRAGSGLQTVYSLATILL